MKDFRIGDKVRYIGNDIGKSQQYEWIGKTGIVREIRKVNERYLVKFEGIGQTMLPRRWNLEYAYSVPQELFEL